MQNLQQLKSDHEILYADISLMDEQLLKRQILRQKIRAWRAVES
jgi:hypothetical protein